MNINRIKTVSSVAVGLFLSACTQTHSLSTPKNEDPAFYGDTHNKGTHFTQGNEPERVFSVTKDCTDRKDFGANLNYSADQPYNLDHQIHPNFVQANWQNAEDIPISSGDLVELLLENGEGFSGRYVISQSGFLTIPLISPIQAAGKPASLLAEKVELELIRADLFHPDVAKASIQVLNLSSIAVQVSGAVFQPGRVQINAKRPSAIMDQRVAAFGDHSEKRLLSEALRAASGVRPDAQLDKVLLFRNGWQVEVDMSGILTGQTVKDYPLIEGDKVIVPSTGCFQSHLVRPSQITPKGFRVFMSNLTDSAMNNASAAVGRYSTNIPYGTRLLQAAVSANCVGGKEWTNAPRTVLLASNHPLTGETQVIERSVEQLMRQAVREDINPYLMPNDAVACYDSTVTNLSAVASTLVTLITPFKLL